MALSFRAYLGVTVVCSTHIPHLLPNPAREGSSPLSALPCPDLTADPSLHARFRTLGPALS